MVTFALALELLEALLYGGAFEWRDIGTDTLGLLTAVLAYAIVRFQRRRS
jgi:hypothetical protein